MSGQAPYQRRTDVSPTHPVHASPTLLHRSPTFRNQPTHLMTSPSKGSVKLPLPPSFQQQQQTENSDYDPERSPSLSRKKSSKWDHEEHPIDATPEKAESIVTLANGTTIVGGDPTSFSLPQEKQQQLQFQQQQQQQEQHRHGVRPPHPLFAQAPPIPDSSWSQTGDDEDGLSDESDDEADFDREISEAMKETEQLAKQHEIHQDTVSWWANQLKKAGIKLLVVAILVGLMMAINFGCKARSSDRQCTLERTYGGANNTVVATLQFEQFTWFVGISLGAYLVATFAIFVTFSILRALPIMGKAASYFLYRLDLPLAVLVTAIVMNITFSNPLIPVTFYPYVQSNPASESSTFIRVFPNLIWCVLALGVIFVGKAISMRIFAILFHRAAYTKRIRQSLLSEKVLVDLMKAQSGKEQAPKAKTFTKIRKGVTGAFSTKMLFEMLPFSKEELLNEAAVKSMTLAGWIEYIKFAEMMLYTASNNNNNKQRTPETPNEQPPTQRTFGRRNALVAGSSGSTESEFTVTPLRLERQPTSFQKRFQRQRLQRQHETAVQALASRLFKTLQREPSEEHIYPEDFLRFFDDEMAEAAFHLFDRDMSGTIKERELYCSLLGIIRERFLLRTAIFDAEQALRKLSMAMTGLSMFTLFVICIMIYRGEIVSVLTMVASVLVALTFAIGNSIKTLFESLLFLFATHPFDIGDRVIVEKQVYTVSKMNLLNTELKRPDNGLVYFSNSLLALKPIQNLRRSPDMIDWITLQVDAFTSSLKLRELENKLVAWLRKRTVHYSPQLESEFSEIEDLNKLTIRFWIQHRGNFSNRRRYRERRSRVLLRIRRLCEQLDISYGLPPQEVRASGFPDMLEGAAQATSRAQRYMQQKATKRRDQEQREHDESEEAAELLATNQQVAAAAGTVATLYKVIR